MKHSATTDDTQAFERRFDLISPRNSTSWWDLNRYHQTLGVTRIMSNPRGESVWSLPSVPTLRGFWHSYSKNMDKEKTYIIYHLLIRWIFNPLTIQDSLRWPHQQFSKEVDTQIDHWRVLPKSKEDVARSSGKRSTQGWGCECTPPKITWQWKKNRLKTYLLSKMVVFPL